MDQFRSLLRNSIADVQFLPHTLKAFPVVPLAEVAGQGEGAPS
jgi:hypothetical protein